MKYFSFDAILDVIFPRSPTDEKLLNTSPDVLASRFPAQDAKIDFAYSILDYQATEVRRLVRLLKYHGDRKAISISAQLLYDELTWLISEKTIFGDLVAPLVVPIPLSAQRKRMRGYNQCTLLAHAIAKRDNENSFHVNPVLKKTRETPSQTDMPNRKARRHNVQGCFAVTTPLPADVDIVLLDDVTTTGSTLREARKALVGAGARNVIAITLAH